MSAKRSLPDAWIDALFARMLSIWGEKFTAQWRGAPVDEMRATWGEALAHVKYEDFRRGVAALFRTKYPPTLPEFRELCARPVTRPASALTDEVTPTPREIGREHTTALRTLTARLTARSHASIDWARKILERDDVTPWQIEQASDAIRLWEATHHIAVERDDQDDEPLELRRIPSPHIYAADVDGETLSRVPGEDDEPLTDPIAHPEGETQS